MDRDLPCQQIVFRAYRSKACIDEETRGPHPVAFLLRPGETGLSVGLTYGAAISGLNKCHGAATLHVGRIRDSHLDVEHRPTDSSQDHWEIVGMPNKEMDMARAMHFANALARQARTYNPPR
jgi:hypothetical protein